MNLSTMEFVCEYLDFWTEYVGLSPSPKDLVYSKKYVWFNALFCTWKATK